MYINNAQKKSFTKRTKTISGKFINRNEHLFYNLGMRHLKHMAQSNYIHSLRRTVQTHMRTEDKVTDNLKTAPDQASTDQHDNKWPSFS